jgi:Mrp family chromosome partitioning ATPase/capsular polysaccharide biosynthesis protein
VIVSEAARQELSIRDYGALIWRRKWIVIAMVVIVPICAVLLAKRHHVTYSATATVALREGDLAATVSGIQDTSFFADPSRLVQTQIALAEAPAVAQAVLKRAGVKSLTPGELLAETAISPSSYSDILYFTIRNRDPQLAMRLASAYAQQYTVFRKQYDTASYTQARASILKRAAQLDATGDRTDADALRAKATQLDTFAELQGNNAVVANLAQGASRIAPSLKREAAIGLALGLVLGVGLALLRDAFDTRVRGPEDITRRTNLPLLARVPPPPRKLERADELVMVEQPTSVEAESFRMLRTNVEFASLNHDVRAIMITSAVEEEGKSTTVANLAVAHARAGKRVALVDLDLRRPRLDKFFKLPIQPGLTNVVLGHASLSEVTAHVALTGGAVPGAQANGNGNGNSEEHMPIEGLLDVIPSGTIPPDPGEFVSSPGLARLLETLKTRYDLVLIDTPPILRVGDALTLASKVSAVVVITKLPGMKRAILAELKRQLDTFPTPTLGFVVTGHASSEGYHAGYYYEYRHHPEATKLVPRGQIEVPTLPPRRGDE